MPKTPQNSEKQDPILFPETDDRVPDELDQPELDEIDFLNVFSPDDEPDDDLEPLPEPGDFWLEDDDSAEPPSAA